MLVYKKYIPLEAKGYKESLKRTVFVINIFLKFFLEMMGGGC